jgi:hypothetical protein
MIKKFYDIMGNEYATPFPDPIEHFRFLNFYEFEMLNDYEKESYLLAVERENRRWPRRWTQFETNLKENKEESECHKQE